MSNYVNFKSGDKVQIIKPALRDGVRTAATSLKVSDEGEVLTPEAANTKNGEFSGGVPHVIVRFSGRNYWIQEDCLVSTNAPTTKEIAALFGITTRDEYSEALYGSWRVFSELVADENFQDHVSLRFAAVYTERLADLLREHEDE